MLKAILFVCALVSAAPVYADPNIGDIIGTIGDLIGRGPGHGPGRPGGPGGYYCAAYDNGWEEHAPHYSCQECVQLHGSCYEECRLTEFACVARGERWGRPFEIEEYGYDEFETERRALWACERRGGSYCQIVGPCRRAERAERRGCEAGFPGPGPGPFPGRPGHPGRPGWPGRG